MHSISLARVTTRCLRGRSEWEKEKADLSETILVMKTRIQSLELSLQSAEQTLTDHVISFTGHARHATNSRNDPQERDLARKVHDAKKEEWDATRAMEQEKIVLEETIASLRRFDG